MSTRITSERMLRWLYSLGLIALVCAFSPFRFDPLFSFKEEMFILAAGVFLLTAALLCAKQGFSFQPLFIVFSVFVLYMFSTVLWVPNRYEAMKESYRLVSVLFLIISAFQIRDAARMRHLIVTGIVLGVVCSILGITEYFSIPLPFSEQGRIVSLFGHGNMLGQFLAVCALWSFFAYVYCNRLRWLWFMSFIVNLFGLGVTNCRSAWLAVAVSFALCIILLVKNKGWKFFLQRIKGLIVSGLIVIALFVCIDIKLNYLDSDRYDNFSHYITKRYLGTYEFGILSGREELWHSTIALIKQKPLIGHGIGNHWIVYPSTDPEYVEFSKYAHNDFLQLFSEGGLIGVGLCLLFLLFLFRRIIRFRPPSDTRLLYYALFAGLFAICVDSLFSYGFYVPVPTYIFAVSCALLLRLSDTPSSRIVVFPQWLKKAVIGFGCISVLCGICYMSIRSLGYWHHVRAVMYVSHEKPTNKDMKTAQEEIKRALTYLPYEPELLFLNLMIEYHHGNFTGARKSGYAVLRLTPYAKKILLLMAKIETALGNDGASRELFSRLRSNKNISESIYVEQLLSEYKSFYDTLHTTKLESKSTPLLLEQLNAVMRKSDTHSAELLFLRGVTQVKLQNWEDAERDFSQCISINPSAFPVSYLLRGMCYSRTGKPQKAVNDFTYYLERNPRSEIALLGCGIAALKARQLDAADQWFGKLLVINPKHPKALRNMGILHYFRGNTIQALEYFEKTLLYDPSQDNAQDIHNLIRELRAAEKTLSN